jgi:hypothetical protein
MRPGTGTPKTNHWMKKNVRDAIIYHPGKRYLMAGRWG